MFLNCLVSALPSSALALTLALGAVHPAKAANDHRVLRLQQNHQFDDKMPVDDFQSRFRSNRKSTNYRLELDFPVDISTDGPLREIFAPNGARCGGGQVGPEVHDYQGRGLRSWLVGSCRLSPTILPRAITALWMAS